MKQIRQRLAVVLSLCMIWSTIASAGASMAMASSAASGSFAKVTDERKMELAPGANYTWNNMILPQGQEKIHYVEFDPKNPSLDLQPGMTDGKVYGMTGVTKMADNADKVGNRVIAAINGDFYEMTTGVPLGLFMGDGEILVSPPPKWDWYAYGLKKDGTSIYGLSPELKRTLHIGGKDYEISEINRMRENADKLSLFTSAFYTSTKTNDLGDEVILDVLSGEVKSGGTLKLKVAEIRKDKGDSPLTPGKVVLSASGTENRKILDQLKVGDEISASFELEDEWKDVKMAVGGVFMLVKDGVAQEHPDKALYPRVAIGTKADGSIIMMVIDGRAPGFSEGVSYDDFGKVLKDMGVVNALCLDGGGSSTFVAKLPGELTRKVLNRPSDGGERKTANGLLLVNKAPEQGTASKLVVQPNMERVLVDSRFKFTAAGVDENGHPAPYAGALQWTVDPSLGVIAGDGKLTAGTTAGIANVEVTAGGVKGQGQVEVVKDLTDLILPDKVKAFSSGEQVNMQVTAVRDGQVIVSDNRQFEWKVEGPIGSIDANGIFTATSETDKNGKIIVKYGNVEASMDVNIGLKPVILEDFENGLDRYLEESGARYKRVNLSETTDEEFVRFGSKAAKLEYDFTDTVGISGAYINTKGKDQYIDIPGYPEKISVWVYGDGKKHWLRGQLRDGNGAAVDIDYTDEKPGLEFTGWKYIEAAVPKGRPLPLQISMPIRYMETKNTNKNAGVLYIDQIRALYGPNTDDMEPPVLKDFSPVDGSTIHTSTPRIHVYGEDFGYDPIKHPATTLIDPDKVRMYVDGQLVQHGFYPPKGEIHYTPNVPLADGVHVVKVKIRDLNGNQAEKEWMFTVDTGASKLVYTGADNAYAGNVYKVEVKGYKPSNIKRAEIGFQVDPSLIEKIEVVAGDKLAPANIDHTIDPDGKVSLKFTDVHQLSLKDDEVLARIEYHLKSDVSGTFKVEFKSGSIAFADKGNTDFSFFGLPMHAAIQYHLRLNWNADGVAEGQDTVLGVVDEAGAPVQGARIVTRDGIELGVTGSDGKLTTNKLTGTVREYELQANEGVRFSPVVKFKVSPLAGSELPYNISVSMGEDPATSRGFTWHSKINVDASVVEIVKKKDFVDFNNANVIRVNGTSNMFHTWDIGTVRVHKAVVQGLEPGMEYVYRVGNGSDKVSEQGSFKTAELDGTRTKFLFFGDSQSEDQAGFKLWGNIVRKAVTDQPDYDFILQAGDMVENGFKEDEWNMWFKAVQDTFLKTTVVSVVGNHEVTGTRKNDDFLAHFNNPQNGIDSLKGSNYSFDYHNAHIAVLNSEYDFEEQKEWLRRDLAATDKTWKIVTFHRGPYGSKNNEKRIRDAWTSAFDELNVDVALNGHDHVYLRTYPIRDGKPVGEGEGTTYIIAGSSGPKFYEVVAQDWQYKIDGTKAQIYVAVEIVDNEMKFLVKNINDVVIDEFSIRKPQQQPVSVELDRTDVTLTVKESVKLKAKVLPAGADQTVKWSVRDASVDGAVTVNSDGVVTGHKQGTAIVRATSVVEAVYAESKITVDGVLHVPVEEVRLDRSSGTLKTGDTLQLHATVLPDTASNKSVVWTVYGSNPDGVATVTDTGLITAMKPGTAVIRAASQEDGAKYADFQLVVEGDPIVDVPPTSVVLDQPNVTLSEKESVKLTATVLPIQATDKRVTWSVRDASVDGAVSVTPDGVVTGHKSGTAVVRATSVVEAVYAQCLVTVNGLPNVTIDEVQLDRTAGTLQVGDTLQLNATVLPDNASNKSVVWSVYGSSSEGVASITLNGLVKALKPGTAVIRAMSAADATKYADFQLKVESEDKPNIPDPSTDNTNSNGSKEENKRPESQKPDPGAAKLENGKIVVRAKRDAGSTTATAVIPADVLKKAEDSLKPDSNGVKKVQIEVSADKEAQNIFVSMPTLALTDIAVKQQYEIVTPHASVMLPSNVANGKTPQGAKTIDVAVVQPDRSAWGTELLGRTANRPAVQLELRVDGKALRDIAVGTAMQVALPYQPSADELARPHAIVVWSVDEQGRPAIIPNAKYDAKTGTVQFAVKHLGTYAVGFSTVTFHDIAKLEWARTAIESLAAKGIIQGRGADQFAPHTQVTRVDFIVLLTRLLNLQFTQAKSGFEDVPANAYYADAVAAAKEHGIVQGRDVRTFGPNDKITRQEMFTITARALVQFSKLSAAGDADTLQAFTDYREIQDYAKESLASLLREGLIQGNGQKVVPQGHATRAEAAVFLERIMNRASE